MKKVVTALALLVASPALMAENHDVGVAGIDYEILVHNVDIRVIESTTKTSKYCGHGVHGCAILGRARNEDDSFRAACNIYVKKDSAITKRDLEITVNHEMKHCYGWNHKEMPRAIRGRSFSSQQDWLVRNHKIWNALPEDQLTILNSSK